MRRQINVINSLSGAELDQGYAPDSTNMSEQTDVVNILNPAERRFSSNAASSDELSCMNVESHEIQSLHFSNAGESSSSAPNQIRTVEIKFERRWPPSVDAMVGPRSEDGQLEPTNNVCPERDSIGIADTQVRSAPVLFRGSSSCHATMNRDTSEQDIIDVDNPGDRTAAVPGSRSLGSYGPGVDCFPFHDCPDSAETSSGSSRKFLEEDGGSGSSLGGWGSSCKRKALEGNPGHSYSGETSSCIPWAENDVSHNVIPPHNASSNLSISTLSCDTPIFSPTEQVNPRVGSEMRVLSQSFTSTHPHNRDPLRNFGRRGHHGHQPESTARNISTRWGARNSRGWLSYQSARHITPIGSVDSRSTATAATFANSSSSQGQSQAVHSSSSSRSVNHFAWDRPSSSGAGNWSGSFITAERVLRSQEEVDIRSITRNGAEHPPMYMPVPEIRSMPQDPTGWNLTAGNLSTSGRVPSTRTVPGSRVHPPTSWFPPHQPTSLNQQSFSESSPSSLFPSLDSEPGNCSAYLPQFYSGPSSSAHETNVSSGSSSHGCNPPLPRSVFLAEGQSDDILGTSHSLRALAADFEGRNDLLSEIRQVLTAMRRGEHVQVEDYMLLDPLIYHSMAEMNDRHRDMRLDVDSMSYEELLALEERIGDVSTGLSEEAILKLMKQQKYAPATTESSEDLEPCCICREEYSDGDELGMLDCGHAFHFNCIKQWLMLKNLCPICKITAIPL